MKRAHIPFLNGIIISDPSYSNDVWCRYESNVVGKDWSMFFDSHTTADNEFPEFSYIDFSLIIGNEEIASRIRKIDDRIVYPAKLEVNSFEIGMDTACFCCGAKDKVNHFGEMMAINTGTDGLLGDVYEFKLNGKVEAIYFMGSIDASFIDERGLFQHFKSGFDAIEKEQTLQENIKAAKKRTESDLYGHVIDNLILIGLGNKKDFKPTIWKYASRFMEEIQKLGYAVPHDYGRGKGKWDLVNMSKEDVIQQVLKQMTPEMWKIILGYQNYQDKMKNNLEK